MNDTNLNKLVSEVLAVEAEAAKEAGALGYMARALVQATLPHRKIYKNEDAREEVNEFKRRNGAFKLTILADSDIGLPYGNIPRLLLAWMTTEAVRTKQRVLVLGHTLSHFMEQLDLIPSGGRWGNITRLRDQMKRLFSASISCTYDNEQNWAIKKVEPVDEADLWWNPKQVNQATLFESTIRLGENFFNEVVSRPVPIDMRALKALKRSPMALDIYCWITYRMFYLAKPIEIPWPALQLQFGADYSTNPQGTRDFKRAYLRELKKVQFIYQEAKVEEGKSGLILKPSKPHVATLPIVDNSVT